MMRTPPAGYLCSTPPVDLDGQVLCTGQGGGGGGSGGGHNHLTSSSSGPGGGLHHGVPTEPPSRDFLFNHCSPTDATVTSASAAGLQSAGNGRVLSRNANGTIAMTSQPTNESELQLYRVLQRANLLSYYDTFIGQGGDDVQQLCEAGEEEFLEIMALVGMASKPLHVRRLQKALQEWVNNPAMFQTPLVPLSIVGVPSTPLPPPLPPPPPPPHSMSSMSASRPMNLSHQSQHNHLPPPSQPPPPPTPTRPSPPMPPASSSSTSSVSTLPPSTSMTVQQQQSTNINSNNNNGNNSSSNSSNNNAVVGSQQQHPMSTSPSPLTSAGTTTMCHMTKENNNAPSPGALQQMQQSQAAALMAQYVISMCDDDPRRMDEIRKYAAIYGRFDCKRKPEKPLTLHEVSVNEAAAQICRHIPALLTRRDELFPLARQVVRDSGYQYSKGHSSRHYGMSFDGDPMVGGGHGGKRSRLHDMHAGGGGGSPDSSNGGHKMSLSGHGHSELTRLKRQERFESLGDELRQLNLQQEELRARLTQARDSQDYPVAQQLQQQLEQLNAHQVQMMAEQSELVKRLRQSRYYSSKGNGRMSSCSDPDPERPPDTDDTDSQYSFSNTSSPSQDVHDSSSQDYPTPPATGSDLRIAPVQMQDIYPLKGSNGSGGGGGKKGFGSGGVGGCGGSGGGSGSGGVTSGGTPHITKQMMQETLMDEGLRVVKELSSQIKEEPDSMVIGGVPGLTLSMAMAMAAASDHSHHHSHHHSHNSHSHSHGHHHQHQVTSGATSPVSGPPYGARYVPPSNNSSGASNGPLRDRGGDSRQNGQTSGDNGHGEGATDGGGGGAASGGSVSSSDVEKAAASTINALLSLSQNAGSVRSALKQELPSPTKSTD